MADSGMFAASYRVLLHEYLSAEFVGVTLNCVGYPSHGTQPVEWRFVLKVPPHELPKWPLGAMVRLHVG